MTVSWHKIAQKEFLASERSVALYFFMPSITERIKQLAALQNDKIKFLFPVKSFAHKKILSLAARYLSGFDVSNPDEFKLIEPYLNSDHMVWCSSPFSENIPSRPPFMQDLATTSNMRKELSLKNYAIRIKPTFLKKENRFGITPTKAKMILKQNPQINSLHVHLSGIENTIEDFEQLIYFYQDFLTDLRPGFALNFGGGFSRLKYNDIQTLVELAQKKLPDHTLYFEPGRWYTNDNSLAIGVIKGIEDHIITCSLSAVCHLRWRGTHSNIYVKSFQNINDSLVDTKLYGATCYENDIIGSVLIPKKFLQIGDLIMVDSLSGYSYGWNHSFNGVAEADVILLG